MSYVHVDTVSQPPATPLQRATVRPTSDCVAEPLTMAKSWSRLGSSKSNLHVPVFASSVGVKVQKMFAGIVPGLPRATASAVTGPTHKPWTAVASLEHVGLLLPPPPPHLHASTATNASHSHGRQTAPRGFERQVGRFCLPDG